MQVIKNGVTISDIGCEGIERIVVSDEDGKKRTYIHLDTGEKLAGWHSREEIDCLIEALQAAREEFDE